MLTSSFSLAAGFRLLGVQAHNLATAPDYGINTLFLLCTCDRVRTILGLRRLLTLVSGH